MSDKIFKCPNHMNVTIKKDGGELVLDESCCTAMVILLKNDGNMANSFYGYHNEKIIKLMNKVQKKYFKSLKKRLKTESEEDNLTITPEGIPEDKKWDKDKKITTNNNQKNSSVDNKEDLKEKKNNLNKCKKLSNSNQSQNNTKSKTTKSKKK